MSRLWVCHSADHQCASLRCVLLLLPQDLTEKWQQSIAENAWLNRENIQLRNSLQQLSSLVANGTAGGPPPPAESGGGVGGPPSTGLEAMAGVAAAAAAAGSGGGAGAAGVGGSSGGSAGGAGGSGQECGEGGGPDGPGRMGAAHISGLLPPLHGVSSTQA